MFIDLGFNRFKTINIDGEEYVKLSDLPEIAQIAFIERVVDMTRDSFNKIKLVGDAKTGIITCEVKNE